MDLHTATTFRDPLDAGRAFNELLKEQAAAMARLDEVMARYETLLGEGPEALQFRLHAA